MAERRMFAKTIVLSDAFLDMPIGARCLYMTLGMVADDDGFVNSPRSVMRQAGATEDDMKILIAKKFVLVFDDGVLVIKHWRINNYLQRDRYKETVYKEDKALLTVQENGAYSLPPDYVYTTVYTQDSIGKVSKGKYREDISLADQVGEEEARPAQIEAEFEELWKLYPRKDGKKDALRYYQRARKKGTTFEQVKAGILNYCEYIRKEGKELSYVAYGSTWFNGERWNDEYISTKKPTTLDIAGTVDLSDWVVR